MYTIHLFGTQTLSNHLVEAHFRSDVPRRPSHHLAFLVHAVIKDHFSNGLLGVWREVVWERGARESELYSEDTDSSSGTAAQAIEKLAEHI